MKSRSHKLMLVDVTYIYVPSYSGVWLLPLWADVAVLVALVPAAHAGEVW